MTWQVKALATEPEPWSSHGGRREPALVCFPLASMIKPWHRNAHRRTDIAPQKINARSLY